MNEIRHNVAATQFKDHGAEEQKKLATNFIDANIEKIDKNAGTIEDKIKLFNTFRDENKPV